MVMRRETKVSPIVAESILVPSSAFLNVTNFIIVHCRCMSSSSFGIMESLVVQRLQFWHDSLSGFENGGAIRNCYESHASAKDGTESEISY